MVLFSKMIPLGSDPNGTIFTLPVDIATASAGLADTVVREAA